MEGVAGQGAPVAVAAAMLIGLGFPALPAAVICLVANTPPVPFGPVGVPTIMMATMTGYPAGTMARAIGLDMALHGPDHPVLHGGGHGRLLAGQGSAAGGPGGGRQLRRGVPGCLHLPGAGTARHHRLDRIPGVPGGLHPLLEAQDHLEIPRGQREVQGCRPGLHRRADLQGLVALPHPHGGHGPLGHPGVQGFRQQDPQVVRRWCPTGPPWTGWCCAPRRSSPSPPSTPPATAGTSSPRPARRC